VGAPDISAQSCCPVQPELAIMAAFRPGRGLWELYEDTATPYDAALLFS
jgi:hypothetical protein